MTQKSTRKAIKLKIENVLKNIERGLTGLRKVWEIYARHEHEYAVEVYQIILIGELYRDVILKFYEKM